MKGYEKYEIATAFTLIFVFFATIRFSLIPNVKQTTNRKCARGGY